MRLLNTSPGQVLSFIRGGSSEDDHHGCNKPAQQWLRFSQNLAAAAMHSLCVQEERVWRNKVPLCFRKVYCPLLEKKKILKTQKQQNLTPQYGYFFHFCSLSLFSSKQKEQGSLRPLWALDVELLYNSSRSCSVQFLQSTVLSYRAAWDITACSSAGGACRPA